ncbi:MAG TPA: Ku protein, partial [Streptosporangiaceae bacterium]|nr:Ku protein [Streptosporangiaceae bacterium]
MPERVRPGRVDGAGPVRAPDVIREKSCSADGSEVPYEEVAKGFELPGGEMVVLTDEDLADLPLTSSKSIEVLH